MEENYFWKFVRFRSIIQDIMEECLETLKNTEPFTVDFSYWMLKGRNREETQKERKRRRFVTMLVDTAVVSMNS